ncbi:2-amino-4-hydroxy-6-hydroxymethyldihydropteridine diphosphokinase [Candidatus Woesearchaeota archaeon]|nr:2-amino-4-hydroxy-6-hydroxymethyldihydropteridine diphosphokinase [Candidatus Woesearchaeota archaeon]
MTLIYLGLGSNLGDRARTLENVVTLLGTHLSNARLSSIYETEPVGYLEQGKFLNAALEGITELEPRELLNACQELEKQLGRERIIRNGPRTIDIDILFYGNTVLNEPDLAIPHPRLHDREFVLKPLLDLCPELTHPILKKTVKELYEGLETHFSLCLLL